MGGSLLPPLFSMKQPEQSFTSALTAVRDTSSERRMIGFQGFLERKEKTEKKKYTMKLSRSPEKGGRGNIHNVINLQMLLSLLN